MKCLSRRAWTAIVFSMAVAIITATRIWYQWSAYSAGQHPSASSSRSVLADMWLLGCAGFVGICLVVALLVLCIRDLSRTAARTRAIVVWGALFVSVLVVLIAGAATARPASHYFLDGFRDWIQPRAQLADIRRWSRSIKSTNRLIPRSRWPREISTLAPDWVSVDVRADGTRELRLGWGGGFMHWGPAVCDDVGDHARADRLDEHQSRIDKHAYVYIDAG